MYLTVSESGLDEMNKGTDQVAGAAIGLLAQSDQFTPDQAVHLIVRQIPSLKVIGAKKLVQSLYSRGYLETVQDQELF